MVNILYAPNVYSDYIKKEEKPSHIIGYFKILKYAKFVAELLEL